MKGEFTMTGKTFGLIGIGLGVTTLIYVVDLQNKFKRDIVDKIANNLQVDVPAKLVDEAIETAVDREVSRLVKRSADQVVYNANLDITREVKSAVNSSFADIKASVSTEVSKQVANLDMWELKQEVKEKAKEMVLSKFDENMDGLLSEFNNNLQNMSKIYGSIADSIGKRSESDNTLKIKF